MFEGYAIWSEKAITTVLFEKMLLILAVMNDLL